MKNSIFIFLFVLCSLLFGICHAQVTQEWVARYNRTGNGNDRAHSLAVDGSGNVYVTGYSEGNGTSSDYATFKYNSSGVQQWEARYNGPGNGWDEASKIAVDVSGNVYVTGYSLGSGTTWDFATIKYNSSGVQQWVARYNGPVNGADGGHSLAVDGSGNVYVTGDSQGSGTDYDYATLKYNSSGVQLWVARYNGPGNGYDNPWSLAVDGSGNVYVTGESIGSGTSSDYATIKYNSSGVQQWEARYNGPGNGDDVASSLAVDGSGNVYVTGWSIGSGTGFDFATIKYNSAGVQQWVARYNGPANGADGGHSLAVDGSGNVYVTGDSPGSGTSLDYATIKYNSSGDSLWVARYNGPGNGYDNPLSIAVDGSGNVYVTGESGYDYATIKYNSSGVQQWAARYNGPGNSDDYAYSIAVDGSGNVYVTGYSYGSGTNEDYATIKYNSSGVQQWVARYTGPGGGYDDYAYSIAVDGSGNVYVTGNSATIKYNSSGVQQWVARYGGTFYSLAVDGSGNVYVTGSGYGTTTDYATIKYNSSGDSLWVRRYNGPGNGDNGASSIAVDGSGNVYVTGGSYGGSGTGSDYATIKYNSSGDSLWVARYNGPGNGDDGASSIAVDGSGNVYVTGSSVGSGTNGDYTTIKYNSSGVQQWVSRYNGPGNNTDYATSLAVDGSGNVYVTGYSSGSGTQFDYATIKYNSSGVQQWVQRYNGPGNGSDAALSLAVDGSGNVYVTGYSVGSGTGQDYATIKYNSSGDSLWVAIHNNVTAYSIAVDGSGNVYETGTNGSDYVTFKYNSSGVQQWVAIYNGPGNAGDIAGSLAVDSSRNVYVTGFSVGSGTGSDYATIKYSQLVGITPVSNEIPETFRLEQNYPNPFNPTTKVRFALPKSSFAKIIVYDALGREMETLVSEQLNAGTYEADWQADKFSSGVYYYKLTAGDFTETKKMVLMK